jgi:hypothetical protein
MVNGVELICKKKKKKSRVIQKTNCMLRARSKQRFGNNYMMTVQTTYFSTSLDDNADTNGTTKLMLLITQTSKKGKAIPLQAWRSPKSSRKLRLPDFKTIGT